MENPNAVTDKQIEAVAMITFRAVFARRRLPDDDFEAVWEDVREEEIFRTRITLMAIHAVARDKLAAT